LRLRWLSLQQGPLAQQQFLAQQQLLLRGLSSAQLA
jgi:hypothetical protein